MELLVAPFLLCLLLSYPLQATASMESSGSGSGQGSGVNTPPCIDNCPVSPLTVMVIPDIGFFMANVSLELMASDDDFDSITFVTNVSSVVQIIPESPIVIVNASIDEEANLTLIVDGENLNAVSTPITRLNISVYANDGQVNSEPCVVTVIIEYLPSAECLEPSVVRSDIQQRTTTLVRQSRAVTVSLVVSQFGPMERVTYSVTIANFINDECPNQCGFCGLTSNCDILLQRCAQFTSEDIIILDVVTAPSISKKRQSMMNIKVVTAVIVPQELPIINSVTGGIPIVPPEVLIQAISSNQAEFENITGLVISGTPTLFFVPPAFIPDFDFDQIAFIVLPIVVTLLVLAMAAGIGVILLVVYIVKAKKRSKVLPVTDNPRHQHSVGKGHMSLEPVD